MTFYDSSSDEEFFLKKGKITDSESNDIFIIPNLCLLISALSLLLKSTNLIWTCGDKFIACSRQVSLIPLLGGRVPTMLTFSTGADRDVFQFLLLG